MALRGLLFGLTAGALGLVVAASVLQPAGSDGEATLGVPNSVQDGEVAEPTLRNVADALGIVFGNDGGQMRSASGPSDVRLVTDPHRTRRTGFYGWEVSHPGMTGPGDSIHLVQSALADVPMRPGYERPAAVRAVPAAEGCTPPAVGPGEKLAKVHVADATLPSGYHAVTDRELAEGAATFLSRLQRAPGPSEESPPADTDPVNMVNVVLTDTGAPLYLVLQASHAPVLWNLHAAPGVRVAQVVLVGFPGQAVSPPTPDTPVTMLPVGPGCAPQPWRDTAAHWARQPNERADMPDSSGGPGGGTFREKAAYRHALYDTWFETVFGEPFEPGAVGAWEAPHVLVGPMPASAEARAVYRPLAGATIVAHEGPLLYVSPPEERERDIADRRLALALDAAGGDLSILNPEPMERAE